MARSTLAGIGFVALLALAGCTPGEPEVSANDQVAAEDRTEAVPVGGEAGAPAPGGTAVAFAGAIGIAWDAVPASLPAGPVTVDLTCDALPHNVVFEGVNGEEPLVECNGEGTVVGEEVAELEAGQTVVYYCSVAGHREGGMEGELTVQ